MWLQSLIGHPDLPPKMSEIYALNQDVKELKKYMYQEFEDIKSEIRELHVKIGEVLDQVA